jgi:hypothetical protein
MVPQAKKSFHFDKMQKRDGQIVDFAPEKIEAAIFKAVTAVNQGDGKISKKTDKKSSRHFRKKI